MKFVDAHCHLDFEAFDEDRDGVVARANAAGVSEMVVAATEPASWARMREIGARYPGVYGSVGIHPAWLLRLSDGDVQKGLLRLRAAANELNAVAIGETGLDGNVAKSGVSLERQADVMQRQLDVADAVSLPVIFHILRAHDRALQILEKRGPLRSGGVVHSYSGAPELVSRYVDLNLHISVAGGVTRPNASRTLDAVRRIPEDRLLLETDAPDQTPSGASNVRNEPAELVRIASVVADVRGVSIESLALSTSRNARALFRFD